MGLTVKKTSFYAQNYSFRPKINPSTVNSSDLQAEGNGVLSKMF